MTDDPGPVEDRLLDPEKQSTDDDLPPMGEGNDDLDDDEEEDEPDA